MEKIKVRKIISKTGRVYTYPIKHSTIRKPTVHHPEFHYKIKPINPPRICHSFELIRQQCLERDNFRCCICGGLEHLDVHHRDYRGGHLTRNPNNSLDNLITLCHSCHIKLHCGVIEKHEQIVRLYNTGLFTYYSIGKIFGVSRQRIHQIVSKYKK